ncbi:hypothetical protein [Wenzhouxiangella sp. XN24]|uniref:hypothetical protein n=1 Tax=Wenzhouxiangella sp. XN24 TaxID=2713569 RepID=UPI0013ED4C87|nr:hypothetical protein [Wenzhouxiangella sp. XN24]NGX17083.1 hypothetical protein [Wenzhouxiangella sp. XN24]
MLFDRSLLSRVGLNGLPMAVVGLAVALAAPAAFSQDSLYIDLDGWRSTGCIPEDKDLCDGHYFWKRESVANGKIMADNFAECLGGRRCIRAIYDGIETARSLKPLSGNWIAHPKNSAISFLYKMGADHQAGIPYEYKAARWMYKDGLGAATAVINYNGVTLAGTPVEVGADYSDTYCSLKLDMYEHIGRWLRFKMWTRLNTGSLSDGSCGIEVFDHETGELLAERVKSGLRFASNIEYQRFAWVFSNVSNAVGPCTGWPPCGGESTRTVFLQNICVGSTPQELDDSCVPDALPAPKPPDEIQVQ